MLLPPTAGRLGPADTNDARSDGRRPLAGREGHDNPTVLVVEDEEAFIEALEVGLRREGFAVEIARDGAEALDQFDVVQPDLVLLDVMLPTVSGIDVCRELRRRSTCRSSW